jgi:hypothetical protein
MTTADLATSVLTSAQQLATTIGAITSTQLATGKVDPNVSAAGTQVNALVTQIQTLQTSVTDDASVIASLQQQLAAAHAAATAMTPAVPTTPAGTTQTYVSAPATMALMAVSAIVGAAGGYAGKSYLDKQKGAREAQVSEGRRRLPKPRKTAREEGAAQ